MWTEVHGNLCSQIITCVQHNHFSRMIRDTMYASAKIPSLFTPLMHHIKISVTYSRRVFERGHHEKCNWYFVKSQTQLEVDSIPATIDKRAKMMHIYFPKCLTSSLKRDNMSRNGKALRLLHAAPMTTQWTDAAGSSRIILYLRRF